MPSATDNLISRFESLAYRTMRRQRVVDSTDAMPPVDLTVVEKDHMAEFARSNMTKTRWVPWLQAQQKQAAAAVRATGMIGGASTQFAVGYEAAFSDLLDKLNAWAETPEPEVETRSMRPLEGVSK